jgi:1-acyl-sn-glycerol-3-phosphate acyltransferase
MEKCKSLLSAGLNLLIFPEGIRSSNSRLMPFADMAFRLAIEHQVPIIPIVIHSDRPFLNRQPGSYFPHKPVQFRIRILPPIPTLNEPDSHRLSDLASRQMTTVLNLWDQPQPSQTP